MTPVPVTTPFSLENLPCGAHVVFIIKVDGDWQSCMEWCVIRRTHSNKMNAHHPFSDTVQRKFRLIEHDSNHRTTFDVGVLVTLAL